MALWIVLLIIVLFLARLAWIWRHYRGPFRIIEWGYQDRAGYHPGVLQRRRRRQP